MMKTKLKTMIGVLRPDTGKGNRVQPKFTLRKLFAVYLLAMVAQVLWAEDPAQRSGNLLEYNFGSWSNNTDFKTTDIVTVKNSLGENMNVLSFEGNTSLGSRFAVNDNILAHGSGVNTWYIYHDGLYCCFGSASNHYLSIMGLIRGKTVTITWKKSNNSSSQLEGDITSRQSHESLSTSENNGTYTTTCTMTRSESLDLAVRRYTVITKIVIEDNGSTNHITFDNSGAISGYTYNGTSYSNAFKTQLSARNFTEPTLSVYPSTANITYSANTISNPTGKEVAVMNENPNRKDDVMFKNIGLCQVTATSSEGGSASYYVEVWDNVAEYVLEEGGTKYHLTAPGILENRVVTAVGGLTMRFGIPNNYPSSDPEVNQQDPIYNDIVGEGDFNYKVSNTNDHYQPNSVVVTEQGGKYVSFIPADNGWWDRYPYRGDRYPYQGTFYTFTAKTAGSLTINGYKSSGDARVLYLNQDNPTGDRGYLFAEEDNIVYDGEGHVTSDGGPLVAGFYTSRTITMQPNQTYIVHGETPSVYYPYEYWNATGWTVFELEWFKFESGLKIADPSDPTLADKPFGVSAHCGTYMNGETETTLVTVTSKEKIYAGSSPLTSGVSVKSGSISWKGSITGASASVNSDGTITFSNITYDNNKPKKGGAIKVTLVYGTSEKDYVMTIPYGNQVWDFRRTVDHSTTSPGDWNYSEDGLVEMMTENGTDWSRVWKVHSKEGGVWKKNGLITPIMAARSSIAGNNAFYMDNTAGLVFVTGPESFGAHEVSNNVSNYESLSNDEKHDLPYTIITGADLVWMKGSDATIYFPGVKAGQYIKIYTYRHDTGKGETYKAKNLKDLDDVTYNPSTTFIMHGMWEERSPGYKGDDMRGCAIFKVISDATNDMSQIPQLILTDNGWTKIYRIEIMDEFKPDLMLTDDNVNNQFYPVDYDGNYSSIVVRKKNNTITPVTRTYIANTGQTGSQHANTCDYEIIAADGVVTTERIIWNSSIGDITSANANDENRSKGVDYNRLRLTFNKAGLVRIIQRERANAAGTGVSTEAPSSSLGYVVDKNEYYINVGELTVQDYPYTWDFTNYNMYKSPSVTQTTLNTGTSGWNATETSETVKKTFGQQAVSSIPFGEDAVIDEEAQIDQNATVYRPCFAQGAQLSTSSGTAVAETEGLGISRPKTTKAFRYFATDQSDKLFKEMSRNYDSYTLSENAIKVNGDYITGVGEITIPEVPNGMYIFVNCSNGNPVYGNVKAGNYSLPALWSSDKNSSEYDFLSLKGGVYCYYQNSGSTQDVVIPLSSDAGQVKEIAVTNILKSIYSTGYATESRDHAIDHTYQEKFTNHPVKAYAITTNATGDTYEYRKKAVVRKSEPITVVPSNTGVVLCQESYSGDDFSSPLFYPAVNITPTSDDYTKLATNRMAANVESTEHTSETEEIGGVDYTKFIMTTISYTYHKEDGSNTLNTEATTEAFYRLKLDATAANNVIEANKAYLLIPTANLPTALWNEGSSSSRGIIYIDLEDVENSIEATKIENQAIIDHSTDNNVYYSISGARINGKPTTKGFYIHNGKKVSIK